MNCGYELCMMSVITLMRLVFISLLISFLNGSTITLLLIALLQGLANLGITVLGLTVEAGNVYSTFNGPTVNDFIQ